MRTRLSTKGQVVLPRHVRHRLGLRPGDSLEVEVDGERLILTPRREKPKNVCIVTDPTTGLLVLSVGPDAPELTSEKKF